MAILKREYELSVWDEQLNPDGIKTEKKGIIIGAHDMKYLGRATNLKLKREIKGTNVLTFDMPQKFFDSELGEYVKNEFIDELYNERKIKLNFDGQWYEFYIKAISEKKQFKSIMKSFTCQDSFIDELSRTGYEIAFDEEFYNNVNEISPFMDEILTDSIWDYKPEFNIGDFTEFKEERFYKIPLSQFGGSISAYPIELKVNTAALNEESDYYKQKKEKDKNFVLNEEQRKKETILTNIYTKEERQLELGDDVSFKKEIFWDNYDKDNGFSLIDPNKKTELSGSYIYVAYSDLSFIYGSVYEDPYKSTEEPAMYGKFGEKKKDGQSWGYALQPTSKDPSALIQFIYFKPNDKVIVDEAGTIVNNDCHYVITVEEWNRLLEKIYIEKIKDLPDNQDKGVIHWYTELIDINTTTGVTETTKYDLETVNKIRFTKNVIPSDSTIDDFTWYPVYYEGYLSEINEQEVFAARKISITNRTEFNKKAEYYTTIYKNRAEDYKGLYSEKEDEQFLKDGNYRVQSMEETRIVVPTLARNLITNGENITTNDGWEALTQSDQSIYNTGSYANLLEVNIKNTTQDRSIYEPDGSVEDEGISDYYLELLSPNIEKCDDFSLEGVVSSDYALNFGLTELEKGIEKDKVYAIRICTGNWNIIDYTIRFRSFDVDKDEDDKGKEEKDREEKDEDKESFKTGCTEENAKAYEETLKSYNKKLFEGNLDSLTIDSSEEDFLNVLNSWVTENDNEQTDEFKKWGNVKKQKDYVYLINRVAARQLKEIEGTDNKDEKNKIEEILKKYPEAIEEKTYETWISDYIIANQEFRKNYNIDLNKIVIGQGSIDLDGNYHLEGVDKIEDGELIDTTINEKVIAFTDIFKQLEDEENNPIFYAGYGTKGNKDSLKQTQYHVKDNTTKLWHWDIEENKKETFVEDHPFFLFKAKANISNPYLGIRSDSEPMKMTIENTTVDTYAETDYSGIKLEAWGKNNGDELEYLVNNANYTVYILDDQNFAESFLIKLGVKANDNTSDDSNEDNSNKGEEEGDKEGPIVADDICLEDGELLPKAKPVWTGKSSEEIPQFFQAVTDNANFKGSNRYALFVNDLYYGCFWLNKKISEDEDKKDDNQKEDEVKENNVK